MFAITIIYIYLQPFNLSFFMCKSPLCLKKHIIRKETPVSYFYNSAFTTKKDIEEDSLPNKFIEENST